MTIVYCNWLTGNDTTGNGSAALPWKTITKGTTGLTGGDEVRVAKSPDPTALTGTLTFTNGSTTLTGSGTAFASELANGDFVEDGSGYWWEVISRASNTSATLYKAYPHSTASGVSSRKLGLTSTGSAAFSAQVQVVSASGTSAARLKISGGWNLSGTPAQTGQTWFQQLNSTFSNRYGYGLYLSGKSYVEIERLHFLRYLSGIYFYLNSNNNVAISPVCSGNDSGIYHYGNNNVAISPVCSGNTNGIACMSNNNVAISPVCSGNAQYGIYYHTNISGQILGTLTASGSGTAGMYLTAGIVTVPKAVMGEATRAAGFTAYGGAQLRINDIGGQSETWTDGGNIVSQNATAGGTGKEWRFNVTSDTRTSIYPLTLEVARVACAANAQVTVTLYFKKSGTGIAGRLLCRGGQIAGVASDVSTTCPDNTSRNQVTITFTPTEAGVVAIEVEAWWVSDTTQSVIIDDISITQA